MEKYSQKISAAVLTYNSEKHIENVLCNLKWCDEIIILDSFSTDKTLEICEKFTNKIYQNKFKSFGEQKQLLTSKCSNKWILSVDSDEILDKELIYNISKLSVSDFETNSGFLIKRKHVFLNKVFKYGKESNLWILRLFNIEKGNFNNNIVHESIIVNGSISKIQGTMFHYTISEVSEAIYKMDLYSKLKAKEYFTNKKKVNYIKLYITFPFTFFREYFLHFNFMNGYEGYIWSLFVAKGAALKYIYLNELINNQK